MNKFIYKLRLLTMYIKHSSTSLLNLNRWIVLIAFLWTVLTFLHLSTLANHSNSRVISKIYLPDLPAHHYRFWLRNHPLAFREYKRICDATPDVTSIDDLEQFNQLHSNVLLENLDYIKNLEYGKKVLSEICSNINRVSDSCWGWESGCQYIYVMPECNPPENSSAKSRHELMTTWFNQADFGYIIKLRRELSKFCAYNKASTSPVKSSLECLTNFKMCRGKSIMFDFADLAHYRTQIDSKKQDLIKQGQVGGWDCDLQESRIKAEGNQRGPLQSWFNELEHYHKIEKAEVVCQETIEEQVFIIKLDSFTNMYHYFCSFINLYATLQLNNNFSKDNHIIIWDNQLPRSKFELMWKAFTDRELKHIGQYQGKRVCFNNYILTLPPRTIGGLYYNTDLVHGCSRSGLFDAFNKHVLHRLKIKQNYTLYDYKETDNGRLRITLISRSSSSIRKILNEDKLRDAMEKKYPLHSIKKIDYAEKDFLEQLETTSNTDLLIGMHGAGLTHTLFLPDWAGLFEVYNCSDSSYEDLARLRGASYFTLSLAQTSVKRVRVEDPVEVGRLMTSKLIDHEKYSNYRIYEPDFIQTLDIAIEKVIENRMKHFEKIKESQLAQSSEEKKKISTSETRHSEL